MAIDPRFVVNLKGKEYPTWPGVLDAATKAGLKSLETELIQIPAEENGWTAIVRATAAYEDGRTFTDYGDASPKNCSPAIALAAIRMASTRAKGRVCRDSVNVGQTMLEELPDDERETGTARTVASRQSQSTADKAVERAVDASRRGQAMRSGGEGARVVGDESNAPVCTVPGCGSILSDKEISGCMQKAWPLMCIDCARAKVIAERESAAKAATAA